MTKRFITTTDQLIAFCEQFANQQMMALDTEFVRQQTFWPQACLIQVAGEKEVAVIDILSPELNPDPLIELLWDNKKIKIFHSARQDLEVFWRLWKRIPSPIADTQIMAMACGFGESISYENLVQKIMGVSLDKSVRVSNWLKRPLSEEQIEYASNDVVYLLPIYNHLQSLLLQFQRQDWIKDLIHELMQPQTYIVKPLEAWKKIGTRHIRSKDFFLFKNICAWREEKAATINMPRQQLISDDDIIKICTRPAQEVKKLEIYILPQKTADYKSELITEISEIIKTPQKSSEKLPIELNTGKKDYLLPIELIKIYMKMKAENLNIAMRLLGTQQDIENMIFQPFLANRLLESWRYEIFGAEALKILLGENGLFLRKGTIETFSLPPKDYFSS